MSDTENSGGRDRPRKAGRRGAGAPGLQDLMESGVRAHESGRLQEAKALYQRILEAEPDHAEANHLLGTLAHQAGRADIAARLMAKAVRKNPGEARYHAHLGYALHGLGKLDEAVGRYRDTLRIDPNFTDAHMGLGNALAQLGRFEDAAASFCGALALDPGLAGAHMDLGNALARLGRFEDAVASYREALAIDGNSAAAHGNLGNALTMLGRLDEAVASCREALRIDPDYIEAHMHLGNALAQREDRLEDAVASYRNALALDPNHAGLHSNLGNALTRLGRMDEAIASYREALGIDPNLPEAHMNLGIALAQRRDRLEDAVASHRRALAIDPGLASAHLNLGIALKQQGRLEDAAASYREALRIDPGNAEAHTDLGIALQALGRFDEAIPHFEKAGTPTARAKVLECHYAAGRAGAFRDCLTELCRSDPVNLEAAAISAFAAQQWGADDPYPFCGTPLDYIHADDIGRDLAPFDAFAARIIGQIDGVPASWEPRANAARGGYHTIGNLFNLETPEISRLRRVIEERIADYRSRYAGRDDGFITRWPGDPKLTGWHVKLLKSGHMIPHIHPSGWLSGVIYLRIPETLAGDEGAVTFSLHGHDYPVRNGDIPTVRHVPKAGDLVLFPSSLFHYTAPFRADEERHCISFDLLP